MQLTYINSTVESISGNTPDECYADPNLMLNMIHPDDLNMMTNYLQSLTLPDGPMLARWIGKDGTVHWMESRLVPVMDSTGQMVAVEGISRNITKQKEFEANQEKLITQLVAKNAELDQFTYTVSHDLKSPLITIRGFLGLLEKDALNGEIDKMRSDMARISEATDKMGQLLSELLELSRIGRVMNPCRDIPFEEIVKDAVSRLSGVMETRGVQLKIDSRLPIVHGDYVRLVLVVQNLMENASKFLGDQPHPCIEIGTRDSEDLGKPIFFVKDNGIGIQPQYHTRIFGLFDKLDTTSTGTGIGLSLVKKIIEIHGGSIWVESNGLSGTTFCFTLPEAANTAENEN